MKLFRLFLAMVVAMTMFSSCHSGNGNEEGDIDLPAIQQKGELTVLTLNSSTSYFSYRGEPMGFQYELAQQFAASLGVKLNIKVVKNVKAMTDSLLAGKGDLIVEAPWRASPMVSSTRRRTRKSPLRRRNRSWARW